MDTPSVTVAIPTYRREQVLLDTLDQLLNLKYRAHEIVVVDQTPNHEDHTKRWLTEWAGRGKIRWLLEAHPSITRAMNRALVAARGEVVLFLDDDVDLTSEIVLEHARAYQDEEVNIVAGQVIQPWQEPLPAGDELYGNGRRDDPDGFLFNSSRRCWVARFMGGNFSVVKKLALAMGGFDENFVKVAYRFEAEFADRLLQAGQRILFFPDASIRHLKTETGGTRWFGNHIKTVSPAHSVGRYYYFLVAHHVDNRLLKILGGPMAGVQTRFHLTHPWWMPVTLVSELAGLLWATVLFARGPRYIRQEARMDARQ